MDEQFIEQGPGSRALIDGLVSHLAETIPWSPVELITGGLLAKGFTADQINDILDVINKVGADMKETGANDE